MFRNTSLLSGKPSVTGGLSSQRVINTQKGYLSNYLCTFPKEPVTAWFPIAFTDHGIVKCLYSFDLFELLQKCYLDNLMMISWMICLDNTYVRLVCVRASWASCQIRKIAGAHAPRMPGTFSPSPQVSDPDMHHGTCVTHVPWCMPGSLTSGSFEIGGGGKRSLHSRRMRNLQFYVSGKRPMGPLS